MGYSCSAIAAATYDAVQAHCIAQTGMQNTYQKNGKKYHFERSRIEHPDGSITGQVFRYITEHRATYTGYFKIDGATGTIIKWTAKPVPWTNLVDRFRELSDQIFKGNSFVEVTGSKYQSEYDRLFPHFAKLKQLGLA